MGVNEYTLKYNRNLFSHTEMHINTVIMKAVSCPPWFQTVQRNNLEAQCTKTKVNTQRIPASGGVVSMVTNTNWCKCASVNEREREQQKRTKYAYTVWSCAYNRTVVKIKKLWFFCKKPFVSRCINTHTHLEVTVVNWCNTNKTEQNWIKW